MSEYYAVIRSTDHLAHYGVKGMKWGVRKAIENRDSKELSKQYKKALKKAKKLNTKANISKSQQEYKGRMSDAAAAGITGAAVAGIPLGARSLLRAKTPHVTTPVGGALVGLGAYQLGKGLAAKRRTTAKGHAKAKAKAESWRSEMKNAFKGTKYAKLPGATGQNKAYEYTPMGSQFKDAAVDSVIRPGYSMTKRIANEPSSNYKKKTSQKRKR